MAKPMKFFKEVRNETKKVTWPSRQETTVTTIMVFIMVALAAAFLFVSDQVIAKVIQLILGLSLIHI